MTKKEAIKEAIDSTSYIGSHRVSSFIEKLNSLGFKITAKKRKG